MTAARTLTRLLRAALFVAAALAFAPAAAAGVSDVFTNGALSVSSDADDSI
jgi:hypothetical protein